MNTSEDNNDYDARQDMKEGSLEKIGGFYIVFLNLICHWLPVRIKAIRTSYGKKALVDVVGGVCN